MLTSGGGASQLPVGLLAAHLSVNDLAASQLSRIGVSLTMAHARRLLREGLDWQPCPLQQRLLDTAVKNGRLRQAASALPDWFTVHAEHLLHKHAAWIKPQALVSAWLSKGLQVQDATVVALRQESGWQALDAQGHVIAQADAVVIAAGLQSLSLLQSCGHGLQLGQVDGAVAFSAWPIDEPAHCINGNGHFIGGVPHDQLGHIWLSGSTYERDTFADATGQGVASLQANRTRLQGLLPPLLWPRIEAQFAQGQVKSWYGSRCTTPDRLPVVGPLTDGLYVCTAMGSRGLSFAALCADVLADEIVSGNSPPMISSALRDTLRPQRPVLKVIST